MGATCYRLDVPIWEGFYLDSETTTVEQAYKVMLGPENLIRVTALTILQQQGG